MLRALPEIFNQPIQNLPGVGSERTTLLAKLEIGTLGALFLHRPRRYEDRRKFRPLKEVQLGEAVTFQGIIVAAGIKRTRYKSLFEFILQHESTRLYCRWWNAPYMERYYRKDMEVLVHGKLSNLKPFTMDHPEVEVVEEDEPAIHMNRVVPIYPATEGITQRTLRSLIWRAIQQFGGELLNSKQGPELAGFLPWGEAIVRLHFPMEIAQAEQARERLALDEFIDLQTDLQLRRQRLEAKARAVNCATAGGKLPQFIKGLPFQLTQAQKRVLAEFEKDLAGPIPMRRLLQGDVGSGKTVVAAVAALMCLQSKRNVALMAPTEILAHQHFAVFSKWFEPLGFTVHLRTGSTKTEQLNQPSLLGPAAPALHIGTHALIEEGFAPEDLGLVIIDEQHKFGVLQREKLLKKGNYPHLLVMTATPIPRTLALSLYGDLDFSIIDEMPSDRGRLRTFIRTEADLPKVWNFVRGKLAEGQQAYVVFPRISEEDAVKGSRALLKQLERLRPEFTEHKVVMVHGTMKADEKNSSMEAFRAGRAQVLLGTSVIEVGLDVPKATVMVIFNADHFGLAQLHQLRGRIGRGALESFCILISESKEKEARERLEVLEKTRDGFAIAEEDFRLRGGGELTGLKQSGMPDLIFGDLIRDRLIIQKAREYVKENLRNVQGSPH